MACIILQTFLREPLSFPMHHFGKSIQHLLVYLNLFRFECWFLHLPVKYQSRCAGKAFGLFLLIYFQYFTANLRAIKELHPVMDFIWVFRFCSETSKRLPLSFNNSSNINFLDVRKGLIKVKGEIKMKKIGPKGLKWLKILHLFFVILFFGGILSSTALNLQIDLTNYDETNLMYKNIIIISDNVVRYGAVGTLLIGFIYGFFTNWGFFKHRWVGVKFVLYIIQTIVGIFVVDKLMVANMELLETQKKLALSNPVFIHNHEIRQYAVMFQVAATIFILIISVLKPWRKKNVKVKNS
jgi:hypothetical protein|nr:DUF2269 family protein [Parageobacillus caldoxylosilyticus]